MDHWISVHIDRRREELHAEAARARMIRMLESGRSLGLRGRVVRLVNETRRAAANRSRDRNTRCEGAAPDEARLPW